MPKDTIAANRIKGPSLAHSFKRRLSAFCLRSLEALVQLEDQLQARYLALLRVDLLDLEINY